MAAGGMCEGNERVRSVGRREKRVCGREGAIKVVVVGSGGSGWC